MNFNMKSSIAVKVFFGLASVLALSSCKDFLTADPIDQVSAGTYFRTESDLELYANGFMLTALQANQLAKVIIIPI